MICLRLVDIEKKLKTTLESKDLSDPEVYTCIYELCFGFMSRNKKMSSYTEAEEVATIMAEELYLKLMRGGSIISWLGYISKSYQAYIRMWRWMNCSEIIDTVDNLEIREAILSMSLSINNSLEYQKVSDKSYLESIPGLIDNILSRSRYVFGTREYIDAKLSILLSLISGKYISYGQNESCKMYTSILLQFVKSEIAESIAINKENSPTQGMTILQLFTLENAGIGDNYG